MTRLSRGTLTLRAVPLPLVIVTALSASAAGCARSGDDQAKPAGPPVALELLRPQDGRRTSQPVIVVRGRTERRARVRVNGKPPGFGPSRKTGRFTASLDLEPGRNRVKVLATRKGRRPAVRTISVTFRAPKPPATPRSPHRLSTATADRVARNSDEAYWLCMESEDCSRWVERCFRVRSNRVDCVVGTQQIGAPKRCGLMASVFLDGDRVRYGVYECSGRRIRDGLASPTLPLAPVTRERLVRPQHQVMLRRPRTE